VSDNIVIDLTVDDSQVQFTIDQVAERSKEVVSQWAIARQDILHSMQGTMSVINRTIMYARQVLQIVGATIDPFFSALLSMVTSTISMMLSVATALAATGVGIPAAAYMAAIAIGLNIVTIAKLVRDEIETKRYMRENILRLANSQENLAQSQRSAIGGSF